MLTNISLRTRMFVMVMLVVGLSFILITGIVTAGVTRVVRDEALLLTQEAAEGYSDAIRAELSAARDAAQTLASVFMTMKRDGQTDRELMNDMLRELLLSKPSISAFCVAYAPNGLDGKDALFAGVPPYDGTGRFAPYWNRLDEAISVEPLTLIDTETWWLIPKNTKREYISEPYQYLVQGEEKTLMSFFFPILDGDEFVGVIASDISIDVLQDLLRNTEISGNGQAEIISQGGVVVAHKDVTYAGRTIYETAVLDDAAAHPGKYTNLSDLTADTAKDMLSPDLLERAERVMRAVQFGGTYTVQDEAYCTVYVPIRFSEDAAAWSVAVKVPASYVLATTVSIRNYIIAVLVGCLCVLAVALYFVARAITKPTLELTQTARELADGHFDVDVPFTGVGSEIGTLARAFFSMASNMGRLVKSLQDNAKDLEEKNNSLTEAKVRADEASHAKSDFLSNMSHEMRTPLNAIIGMTAIGRGAGEIEKKDYALRKIEDASTHLLGVVNDVLDMAKIEAHKLELSDTTFEFEHMLRRITGVIAYRVDEKRQTLTVDVDGRIPRRLVCDEQRLGQVLANLLSNAVKFTPEDGGIKLAAALLGEADGVCRLLFTVTDSGIGISEEQQSRLFASFQQADSSISRRFGGTGLGLAISKRIVEMMGGEIHVESELGKGSSFVFTVNAGLAAPEAADDGGEQPAGHADVFAGHTILLAEDVEINREIVLALLEPSQLAIDCAENGEEALRMFSEAPGKYEMIFMDMQMPLMDGLEATKRIRALDAGEAALVPIIAMTANVFREDIERCLDAGMNDHLGKPLELDAVYEKLRHYLK